MQLEKYPINCPETDRFIYKQRVFKLLAEAQTTVSAPILLKQIADIQTEMFGVPSDYTEIKRFYNDYVMKKLPHIEDEIARAESPLLRAIQYSLTGNYIDFGALKTVDHERFEQLLQNASEIQLSTFEYNTLTHELLHANQLVFLTDNCGEIVFDQALIRTMKRLYPQLQITVIVRGEPILNDATLFDAEQIGLINDVRTIGNGTNIAGTCLDLVSNETRNLIESADLLIAKGQGNFETLQHCGLNVYYLFMCKCEMFANKFDVNRYTGLLLNDKRLPI